MTTYQPTPGGSNGATATTADSGFSSIVTSGGNTVTYDSSIVRSGTSMSFLYTFAGSSGVAYGAYSTLNGAQWRMRLYVYLTALPNVEWYLGWLSSGTTVQASVGLLATGKLVQRASGTAGTGNSGSVVIPLNTWVRIEFAGTVGSAGTMQSAMYSGESTTALDSLSTTGQNTGTANLVNARFGLTTTTTATGSMRLSGLAVGDDSSTFFGPAVVANTPPTISGPGTVNTTASTASLTFQASDTGGTIASFALVNQSNTANSTITPTIGTPTLTGIGTANATATFPVSGLTANAKYFFGATATDNSGAMSNTSVATVNVTKDIPDIRSVAVVGFTVVGGGAPLDAIIAGNAQAAAGQTVTRYLESTAPPGGASVTVTFQPVTPSGLAKAFAMPIRAKDTTSTETATATLKMNDTTTIATRGPFTLTTTATSVGGTTTTGSGSETAAITDHSKLSIVVVTN